jgi:hypothetical protein
MFNLDHPTCVCGREMRLKCIAPSEQHRDITLSEIHTFDCNSCQHEQRVMHDIPSPPITQYWGSSVATE